MTTIDIRGLPKDLVLKTLYDAAHPRRKQAAALDPREALALVRHKQGGPFQFGLVNGREIHADLTGDVLDARAYDRANGAGRARAAIKPLRG